MPLPRWMLLTPFAALIVAGVGTRVASCARRDAHTPPASDKKSSQGGAVPLQNPRAFDAPTVENASGAQHASETANAAILTDASPFALLPPIAGGFASLFTVDGDKDFETRIGLSMLPNEADEDGHLRAKMTDAAMSSGRAHKKRGAKSEVLEEGDETAPLHWKSPQYEDWKPTAIYGPPPLPERERARRQAHRLLQDLQAGRLAVMMDERDGEQLRRLERDGVYCWPAPPPDVVIRTPRQREVLEGSREDAADSAHTHNARLRLASRGALPGMRPPANPANDPDFDPCVCLPAPALLRMLNVLAAHSTPARPLEVMSLLRPPYRFGGYVHVGAANPHSLGLAVDIAAYGGYAIRQASPEQCVAATLALLRALPPGRYRLGMPKAPEAGWDMPPPLAALLGASDSDEAAVSAPAREPFKKISLKIFSEENTTENSMEGTPVERIGCAIAAFYGLHVSAAKPTWPFFPPPYTEMVDTPGAIAAPVLRFQNEAYAPESALADPRLRRALEAARSRGADVVALFPDGADHIHIDVRQNP